MADAAHRTRWWWLDNGFVDGVGWYRALLSSNIMRLNIHIRTSIGQSVAEAIHKVYAQSNRKSVLVLAGPGNNGGDGLVAARWLSVYGWDVTVWYPTRQSSTLKSVLYTRLVNQCEQLSIPIVEDPQFPFTLLHSASAAVVIDAIFGFGYQASRSMDKSSPLTNAVAALPLLSRRLPVVAVDVPSGWPVDDDGKSCISTDTAVEYMPDMLVSLTAPKRCAKRFHGRHHFLGGRGFISRRLMEEFSLESPMDKFVGCDQTVPIVESIV